jgi:predicted DNA-binding ribbon-helix-helix protein
VGLFFHALKTAAPVSESVSLEEAFWKSLQEIAHERNETLSFLVSGIDANRENANLSSAIRVFIRF